MPHSSFQIRVTGVLLRFPKTNELRKESHSTISGNKPEKDIPVPFRNSCNPEPAILLVRQRVSDSREWSLPGGRVEDGETLQDGIVREMKEETGLTVGIQKLLYICDVPGAIPPLLHITFLLDERGGTISLPTNELDDNPISDVQFVPVSHLPAYGFSAQFAGIVFNGFPYAGGYMGPKSNIGL